eukprot:XP_014786240.1 PREDICTED: peroxisomal sarcosine oxidase-like isoform X2 [Octopus bimaculoides]
MAAVYDAIVVGAGINGSSTAHYLQKNGYRTLLLEQFPLPHTRGSSHGQSRIIRKAYLQEIFASMMREAYPMWEQLERDSGTQIYTKRKFLVMCDKQSNYVDRVRKTLSTCNMAFEDVSNERLLNEFNIKLTPGSKAIIDPEGGILHADKALSTYQDQFVKKGGTLIDETRVLSIIPGQTNQLNTSKGTFQGRNIVLCLGPWAKSYFQQLGIEFPLKVMRISVGYYKQKPVVGRQKQIDAPLKLYAKGHDEFYGLPEKEYPGLVKFCLHKGPEVQPDHRDQVNSDWTLEKCKRVIEESFLGLEPEPSIVESCLYTMTPDELFVLDRHPKYRNIILAAGFSGHGFKLAPVTGKILGEMAMNKAPSYDLNHFRLDRFTRKSLFVREKWLPCTML